jgi:uncharacterized protein
MPTIDQSRSWYSQSDPVHGFDHILRVYRLADRIGQAEGADIEIVRAAVLLHDSASPVNQEHDFVQRSDRGKKENVHLRENHHHSSADFARQVLEKEGWPEQRIEAVLHCIRAHRFRDNREAPQTLEAKVVFDADKLDAIGAIGAARAIAYAASAGQPSYAQPSEQFLVSGQREPDEPHSSYHEFVFKLSHVKERLYTPTARSIGDERHRYLAEFYERLGREIRGEI